MVNTFLLKETNAVQKCLKLATGLVELVLPLLVVVWSPLECPESCNVDGVAKALVVVQSLAMLIEPLFCVVDCRLSKHTRCPLSHVYVQRLFNEGEDMGRGPMAGGQ